MIHTGRNVKPSYNLLLTEARLFQPPGSPPLPPDPALQSGDFKDTQFAVFGEVGVDLTSALRAAFSFRWFTLDQEVRVVNNGFNFTAQALSTRSNSDAVFTPKFKLSWQPNVDQLWYLTAAEGFRTGVINSDLPFSTCGRELAAAGFPNGTPATDPDTVMNYELGAKLQFAQRRVTLNAAVYRIDWSDLQGQVILPSLLQGFSRCNSPIQLNLGDARSEDAEVELSDALTERLEASLPYSGARYLDAYAAAGICRADHRERA